MKRCLVLFCALYSLGFAQISWSPTYNLSSTPSATSDYHCVYSDISGYYYVAWQDNGEIKFKYSSDRGQTWSNNVTAFSSSSIAGYPVIKADYNNVFIAFHQNPGAYEVIFISSTDFGATWTNTIGISGMDSGSQTPQMAYVYGNIYVIWEQKPDMISNVMEIYFTKSTDWGQTWSVPINLSNSPSLISRWAQIECIGNTVYCSWLESPAYPESDIYFSKSTDAGNSWSIPVNITNNARPQNRIFMDVDYNDNIYIASDDIITFNFDEIYLMRSTDDGLTWSTPINITNNTGHSNTPCIKAIDNTVYLTWSDNSHSAPAFDNSDIFFKWSSDGGITWQDSINISANSDISSSPRFCFSFDGPIGFPWFDFTIVWYDYSLGDSELLARRGIHYYTPVELHSFTATVLDNDVTLSWTTATETNNSGFEIERSVISNEVRNLVWETIGFVNGNGTTTEPQTYSFIDKNLSAGKYQYRLKQIDFDGTFEYLPTGQAGSNIVEVDLELPTQFILEQNYPNPFNPTTKISWQSPINSHQTLKVYDVLGNEVATLVNEFMTAGKYVAEFNANKLASGFYYYQLKVGDFIQTRKMILLK